MTVRDYARVIRRGWIYIVAGVVLGLATAYYANLALPSQYKAEATVYVLGQGDGDYSVAAAQVAAARLPSYRALVTERRVLDEVITKLGLPGTAEDLADRIVVSNAPDTLLLTIAVTDPSPQQAAAIVNTVADTFLFVAEEVDAPLANNQQPVVFARVIQYAQPADADSSRRTPNILFGLLIGFLVGLTAAFVRDARGWQVGSVSALKKATGAPNLGLVGKDRTARSAPLQPTDELPRSWTDDFAQLATNLQLVDFAKRGKAVVVTAVGPRAGTTTTVCNLAVALAARGHRVVVVDADLRSPRVADLMGVDAGVGLTGVLTGVVPIDQALRSWGEATRLDVLPAGAEPPDPAEFLGSEQMTALVRVLRGRYDMVLFDAPPLGVADDAALLAAKVDGAVLACRPRRTNSRRLVAALDTLGASGAKLLATVATFTTRRRGPATAPADLGSAPEQLRLETAPDGGGLDGHLATTAAGPREGDPA